MKTGDFKHIAGQTVPSGWLICDGAAVSRIAYAALFTVIGTTYGTGDGSTTFNLPDARGRCLVSPPGASVRLTTETMSSVSEGGIGGSEIVSLTGAQCAALDLADIGRSQDGDTAAAQGYAADGANHNNVQPTLIIGCVLIKT